jgi:hypothetical protein
MAGRTRRLVAAALVVVTAGVSLGPAAPRAHATESGVDAQSLVGDWAGEWVNPRIQTSASTGRYYLIVERVAGDQVYLRIERPDLKDPRLLRQVRGVGHLAGNRLVYGPPNGPRTELVIDGRQMRGTMVGQTSTFDIALNKVR